MASSIIPSIQKSYHYDVFLSFTGQDTRKTFVDHIYAALLQQGIHTFKDDKRLKKGQKIDNELIKSIQDSKFFIIVFSKNYASSSWCLDELVKIMECHKTNDQTAFPVFYDVEPSEVRKQVGSVGKAFAKLKKDKTKTGKWREALKEAADLAGWELKNTVDGHEAVFIKTIVEEISLELRSITLSDADEKLVGMERRIKVVEPILETGCNDVRMIGIKGIGGGGKTTLARAIYDQISRHFEGKSFVENVREVTKTPSSGLKSLQKQVLSDILNDQGIIISSVHEGENMMKKRLRGKKVLVVLDDVDHTDQLEALAGALHWFKPGSRILITTRDEQVLIAHRVNYICDVSLLSNNEAIRLFSRYAFGTETPVQGCEELSEQVVRYAAGLPLTIRVLGSFLCGKNDLERKDALERLRKIPLKEDLEKLELSFIGLEDDYKEMFLDVACLMMGFSKDYAIRILESCGFHARNGLRVLELKSLITSFKYNDVGYLTMHYRLQEMADYIVRRDHPDEPRKHSRLWIQTEIQDILANNMGTEATKSIWVWLEGFSSETLMKGLRCMKKLRVLLVESEGDDDYLCSDWKFDEAEQYFPNALRYINWVRYPYQSLPKTFEANNLVALEMRESRIEQLWEDGERKVLNSLTYLDLSFSNLMKLDLRVTPNLKTLNLEACDNLTELHLGVGCLKLTSINLNLSNLKTLEFELSSKLETLESPTSIEYLPDIICMFENLNSLTLDSCWILEKLPDEIDRLECLERLVLLSTRIRHLPESICMLDNLKYLTVESHTHLEKLPDDIGQLQCLETLHLLSTRITHLPDSICMLKKLKSLKLESCWLLEKLPDNIGGLQCLEELHLLSTAIRYLPNSICTLKRLKSLTLESRRHLEMLPEDIGDLGCLEELHLLCARVRYLPDTICMLKRLKSLKLECFWLLEKIPEDLGRLESLEYLLITECALLQDIPNSILKMRHCIIGFRRLCGE